jgi:hypothetical protein
LSLNKIFMQMHQQNIKYGHEYGWVAYVFGICRNIANKYVPSIYSLVSVVKATAKDFGATSPSCHSYIVHHFWSQTLDQILDRSFSLRLSSMSSIIVS